MALNTSVFERQRRAINSRHASESANNQYTQFLSQQRGNRQIGDFKRNFERQQPSFTARWGQRGMTGGGIRSGAFQQQLQRRLGDYTRDLGRMQTDLTQAQQQGQLQQAKLDAWREEAFAMQEADKAAEIAQAALNLKAVKPYF
jgi:hypothetical protein